MKKILAVFALTLAFIGVDAQETKILKDLVGYFSLFLMIREIFFF